MAQVELKKIEKLSSFDGGSEEYLIRCEELGQTIRKPLRGLRNALLCVWLLLVKKGLGEREWSE